ncbi:MAG: DsbA family protein [Candidatus Micrarchaeota archaeon]|nr:DsbA family protein [Candidatus Micrarchaeota archaeon]
MLCFVALFVFAFLSVFSAKYRPLAARAFDCAVRKATLRPCETGLDEELKAASIAGIMRVSPAAASFVNRHFEAFSLAFAAIFFASFAVAFAGIYNFAVYGNCNGPQGGFCAYNSLHNTAFLKAPGSLDGITAGNASAKVVVIEFGCYVCPYTKSAESDVREMLEKHRNDVYFVFKPFPILSHPHSTEAALAASCAGEQGRYWEYRQALFENQADVMRRGDAALLEIAHRLNISPSFDACYTGRKFLSFIQKTEKEGQECGIYGTPTFFVNGKPFVGQNAVKEAENEVRRLLSGGGDGT